MGRWPSLLRPLELVIFFFPGIDDSLMNLEKFGMWQKSNIDAISKTSQILVLWAQIGSMSKTHECRSRPGEAGPGLLLGGRQAWYDANPLRTITPSQGT